MNKYTSVKMARESGADKCDVCEVVLTDDELTYACQTNDAGDGNTMLCSAHEEEEEANN